jgi:chorismate-pyruvate lyase
MKTLNDLKEELNLAPLHVILLANTGSMTVLLEALFGNINIEAETQKIIEANQKVAKALGIKKGSLVNYRVVKLKVDKTLVHATSYAPVSRLKIAFKDDVLGLDLPIGRILEKHSIESRREIIGFDWFKAGDEFSKVFQIPSENILLKREYNIIHGKKPLINITEVFPLELVDVKQ